MAQYRHQTTGHVVTPYDGLVLAGQVLHSRISAESMAELGYLPYTAPPPVPETLEAAQARRTAELAADYESSVQRALPVPLRLEIEAGLREPGGQDAYAAALLEFRERNDAAVAAIAAAGDVAAVDAVAWTWPEVEVAK